MAQSQLPASPMALSQICNTDEDKPISVASMCVDTADPDVQLAAEALGGMAQQEGKIALPQLSGPTSPTLRYFSFSSDSSIATTEDDHHHHHHHPLIHPSPHHQQTALNTSSDYGIVNSAWRAYQGSSNMVKYGAEMVGSIYGLYNNNRRSSSSSAKPPTAIHLPDTAAITDDDDDVTVATAKILAKTSISDHPDRESLRRRRNNNDDPAAAAAAARRSTSPYAIKSHPRRTRHQPTSTWQQLVVHASSAAGTTAAVISEESMKCLRYCLSWLQYAIHHIEQQMALLRSYLVSLATAPAEANPDTVQTIKKEIVNTVRKVVEVVSKYAGSSLPQQAKETVRGFILGLPAKANASLKSTNAHAGGSSESSNQHMQEASIKLLNFGGESIEMLQSVSDVFSDTVDRAELWLDRLHHMGVTTQAKQ
ncbi:transcription factor Opi1-domain-containing protein [Dichotomocladium elegans]|nr:transcription factor Opi1-domain-containing protein [Dichotomocladium elegans]